MKKYEYLQTVEKQIKFAFDHKKIRKELEDHIDDLMEDLMSEGYSKEEAEEKAIEMMGNPLQTGKELNKVHSPLLGHLLVITRLILLGLICFILLNTFPSIEDTIIMFSPIKSDMYYEEVYINEEYDLKTYNLIIDYYYRTDNYGAITYRMFKDYDYSRSNLYSTAFHLKDSSGEYLMFSGSNHPGLFGRYGWQQFELPEDKIIIIETGDGRTFTLDLEEYVYE